MYERVQKNVTKKKGKIYNRRKTINVQYNGVMTHKLYKI